VTAFVGLGVEFSLGQLPVGATADVEELELTEAKRQANQQRAPVLKPWSPIGEMAR
jgi:hypothetical protein